MDREAEPRRLTMRLTAAPNSGTDGMLLRWAHAAGFSDVIYGTSTWTFATPRERSWWSALWAERCTSSSFAQQAVDYGITTAPELLSVANGWREWARDPDAVFVWSSTAKYWLASNY